MGPNERNEQLRQEKFERHPDAARYIESLGYKADMIIEWVYEAMQGYAEEKLKEAVVVIEHYGNPDNWQDCHDQSTENDHYCGADGDGNDLALLFLDRLKGK